ncbi:MAG: three component ABC system middle component [Bacteroidia bacterium]
MSRFVNNIFKIHNNPFILSPLIIEFFRNTQPKSKNILLAYLVFPLILNEDSRENLQKVKVTSSIHTFGKKRENFYGLPGRVQAYKDITNKCIQYAIDSRLININEDLSVDVLCKSVKTVKSLNNCAKASSNLHKIFKDLDVIAIYRLLGIKSL